MAGAGSSIFVDGAAGSSRSFALQSALSIVIRMGVQAFQLYDVLSSLPCFLP
jgi:hypothetical protein